MTRDTQAVKVYYLVLGLCLEFCFFLQNTRSCVLFSGSEHWQQVAGADPASRCFILVGCYRAFWYTTMNFFFESVNSCENELWSWGLACLTKLLCSKSFFFPCNQLGPVSVRKANYWTISHFHTLWEGVLIVIPLLQRDSLCRTMGWLPFWQIRKHIMANTKLTFFSVVSVHFAFLSKPSFCALRYQCISPACHLFFISPLKPSTHCT